MAKKANGPVNVAVIGLGIGRNHLKSYLSNPQANVVGICDADPKKLMAVAADTGIDEDACFTDYKDLLARADSLDLQAVSVALPNFLHAPVTKAAFQAGCHVLCEKPIAMTAAQGRQMIAAGKKAGRTLMINLSFRYTAQSRALKRAVEEGLVGDIYYGRTVWHRRRGLPGFGGWFGQRDKSGGGPIIDLGVHRLDLAMWLMGNPRPVTVSASTYNVIGAAEAKKQGKAFDVEDLGGALIRFDNGATLILEASWAGFAEKREDMVTQLWGTEGGLAQRNVGEGYDFEALLFQEKGQSLWSSKLQQPMGPCPSAYEEFIEAIMENRKPLSPGEHGLDVQLILDAIYKSAAAGKEVRIPKK
ncbi:MAG: Gfo/Idh/MocA family protein [Phycisphaerae bacterium]